MIMTLPLLVPKPRRPDSCTARGPQRTPTHDEWTALCPEIKHLYVHERRKLQYIMQYVEREHGFKAT